MRSNVKRRIGLMSLVLLLLLSLGMVSCTVVESPLYTSPTVDNENDLYEREDAPDDADEEEEETPVVYVADVSVVDGEIIVTMSDGSEKNLGTVNQYVTNNNLTVTPPADTDAGAVAASKTLLSTVGIQCGFTVSGYAQGPYGGLVPTEKTQYGYGSGVIYRLDKSQGDAYIITNFHVVYSDDCLEKNGVSQDIGIYMLGDNEMISATYVGGSDAYDIAVLKITGEERLKTSVAEAVTIFDGTARAGDEVMVVGNANADGISVTEGIVSVDSEYIVMTEITNSSREAEWRVMRIDAPVNPGNSGGGLYNDSAELIGIINAKMVEEDTEGMGYAIPIDVAVTIADKVIDRDVDANGITRRVLIGVMTYIKESRMVYNTETGLVDIVETIVIAEDEPASGSNAAVDGVTEGGLADMAGLTTGDIFVSVQVGTREAVTITRQYQIVDEILKARAGDTLTIVVLRDGSEVTCTVTVPLTYYDEV